MFLDVWEAGNNFAFDIGVEEGPFSKRGARVSRVGNSHSMKIVTGVPEIWHMGLMHTLNNAEGKVIEGDGTVIFGEMEYWHRDGRTITSSYYPFRHSDMREKQMLKGLPYFAELVSSAVMCLLGASYFSTSGTPSSLRMAQVRRIGLSPCSWIDAEVWRNGLLRGVQYHLEAMGRQRKKEDRENGSIGQEEGRPESPEIKDIPGISGLALRRASGFQKP